MNCMIIRRFLLVIGTLGCLAVSPAGGIAQDLAEESTPQTITINGEEIDFAEFMAEQRERAEQEFASLPWQMGPTTGDIGGTATVDVPEGHKFLEARGARQLLEMYGNPPDDSVQGAIVPTAEGEEWTLIFMYDPIGYVDDSDREELDADELLSGFRAGIPAGNAARREYGGAEIKSIDWEQDPFYDTETNNLTWALNLGFTDGATINYDIRMLGRRGVMKATLIGSPETYAAAVPRTKQILAGYRFNAGDTYGEWKTGDKVAAVGLAGLVAGGAAVAASKTGLLAKLGLLFAKGGKAVIIGVIAVFAGIGSFIKKLFGGGSSAASQ